MLDLDQSYQEHRQNFPEETLVKVLDFATNSLQKVNQIALLGVHLQFHPQVHDDSDLAKGRRWFPTICQGSLGNHFVKV